MKEIKIENGKYYLNNVEDLEYYTKKDILKTKYQRTYRIKKSLLSSPFGTMAVRHIDKNIFSFYYLDDNKKLHSFVKVINIH